MRQHRGGHVLHAEQHVTGGRTEQPGLQPRQRRRQHPPARQLPGAGEHLAGRVRLDGPASQVFARTEELERWGVLAPPLARLQTGLLGSAGGDVLLTVEDVAAAALAHGPAARNGVPA